MSVDGSINVVIRGMVRCHNWTDGQMSQSDPEAIRGIRAVPGPRPYWSQIAEAVKVVANWHGRNVPNRSRLLPLA